MIFKERRKRNISEIRFIIVNKTLQNKKIRNNI